MIADQVRDLLRKVPYPGFSRDIVSAGFVGEVVTKGSLVEVEFKPNTRDEGKISEMEHQIRYLLLDAKFLNVQIRRINPFVADKPLQTAEEIGVIAAGVGVGGSKLMTPLQAEFLEDGELPEADLLAIVLGRHDIAAAAGYGPGGPKPLSGPREDHHYDCATKVLQWDIDPHNAQSKTCQHEIKLGEWDYRVWWQIHPCGDLLYVSMQAMREDWVAHEDASPHPIGRSEAVNLVYDETRGAVVAIYGTVRDFRPFVHAFSLAHAKEHDIAHGPTKHEGSSSEKH